MHVALRRGQVRVPRQFLDRPRGCAPHREMRAEGMSQDVNAVVLEPSQADGPANLVLHYLQGERAAGLSRFDAVDQYLWRWRIRSVIASSSAASMTSSPFLSKRSTIRSMRSGSSSRVMRPSPSASNYLRRSAGSRPAPPGAPRPRPGASIFSSSSVSSIPSPFASIESKRSRIRSGASSRVMILSSFASQLIIRSTIAPGPRPPGPPNRPPPRTWPPGAEDAARV